jgi:cytochrome c peroxidase
VVLTRGEIIVAYLTRIRKKLKTFAETTSVNPASTYRSYQKHLWIFTASFTILLLLFTGIRWTQDYLRNRLPPVVPHPLFKTIPTKAPDPSYNQRTPEKIELGKMLFFEPRLSKSGNISCQTCHILAAGGADHHRISPAQPGIIHNRNTPTVFNSTFASRKFWDGRAQSLEDQLLHPITSHSEMDLRDPILLERLLSSGYFPWFETAFPEEPQPITPENIAKAIAAFERTLITPGDRFDQYLNGNYRILNQQELAGLALFQQSNCVSCHFGPILGAETYMQFSHKMGNDDQGRGDLPGHQGEENVFRVAPLRNVALTYPYFHDGSADTLEEAVASMLQEQLKRPFTDAEVTAIVAFLHTLTGPLPEIPHPLLPR